MGTKRNDRNYSMIRLERKTEKDAAATWLEDNDPKFEQATFKPASHTRVRGKPLSLHLIATNASDQTITMLINGARYEYWLGTNWYHWPPRDRAPGRILNWLKHHSHRCVKLV